MSRITLRLAVLAYLALLLVIPLGAVVWRAVSPGLGTAWADITTPDARHAILLTLVVAAIAVPLNTLFGLGAGLLVARRRLPGVRVLAAVADLPLAVSPVVAGVALLLVYGRQGWLGPWLAAHGIQVVFSPPGIVVASAFVSLPYVVREVVPVLRELGTDQQDAAATLGAGPLVVFWRVTLPSLRRALAYGVTLTTARVLGEFGAVSVIGGQVLGQTQTLTLFVDDQFVNFDRTGAYAGALLLCLASLAVLGMLGISRPRREEALWLSPSVPSPNGSPRLPSWTASPSMSPLDP